MVLDNVRLLVVDFDACYNFYKDTLGFDCKFGNLGDAYASFSTGNYVSIGIFRADLMAEAVNNKARFIKTGGIDNFALILQVTNLENTYEKLLANGVEFINAPTDMPDWGIKIAHFRDPDGNLLEIFSPL